MPDAPELKTRKPTGKPPWPMIVVAGAEKTGKSWSGAEFSASDLIDRTFWVEIGEGAADQYGALPGARYEIVEHDGTYQGIGNALWAATRQPRGEDGKPHAIVVDGVTALWDMLSDEAQGIANARAKKLAESKGRKVPVGDRTITTDLWNGAKKRWARVIDMLRKYDGPVILLARLELVTVMKGDTPTTEKTWKIRAEKNLPHEADAVVRFTAPRKAELTGVRSVVLQLEPGEAMPLPDFTLDGLLRELGLGEPDATAPRSYTAPVPVWMEAEADIERDTATPKEQAQQRHQERREQHAATARAAAEDSEPSTHAQRTKLILAIRDKRGVTDDAQQRRILGELLGREVASRKDITFAEASRAIETLEAEPDFIADAETVPDAPQEVQNRLLVLLEQRLDLTDHDDRMRWITGEVGRHVATAADLTLPEATGLIERLAATPERAQPWDNQPQVPPAEGVTAVAQAKAAVQQDGARERDGSWSHRMAADRGAPLTTAADGSDQMFEDMAIAIADATDPNELEGLYLAAKHAHELGKLTAAQFGKLDQLGRAQNEDLRAKAAAMAGAS